MSTLKISSIENVAGTKYMDGTDFIRGTPRAYVSWVLLAALLTFVVNLTCFL